MATLYVYGFKSKTCPVETWYVTTSSKEIADKLAQWNIDLSSTRVVYEAEITEVKLEEFQVRHLIGQLAGGLSTEKKAAAARENGKKSRGRPRKTEKPKPKTTPKKARIDPVDKEIPELDLK
jgi:hypothetical protein